MEPYICTQGKASLFWHISALTCQIIMSICQIFLLTFQLFMLTCQIIVSTCQKNITTSSSLFSYAVNATNCYQIVSLISDKSTLLSDKST